MAKPLLRRLQVLPPESYEDASYGDLIKRKRKKYLSSGQAFGVKEGMGDVKSFLPLIIFVAMLFFLPVIIIALPKLFTKR